MNTPTIIYEVTLHNNFSLIGHSEENLFSHQLCKSKLPLVTRKKFYCDYFKTITYTIKGMSSHRKSLVSIVVRWRGTQLWNHGSISGRRNFSLLQSVQPVSCARLISCSMDPGEKQPGREIGHSLFSSVEEWMKIHLHCSISFLVWTGKFLRLPSWCTSHWKFSKYFAFFTLYWRSWGLAETCGVHVGFCNKCGFI